ncbi:MAG: DUF3106 domain-containing protein [Acidiferrobacterales bacterium]
MKRRSFIYVTAMLALCAGLIGSAPARASAGPGHEWQVAAAYDWNNLSPAERRLLANRRRRWGSYPPQRRARLVRGVQRYQRLSPAEQARARRARRRFRRMSPQERRQLREKYLRYRRMPRR